jgi:hypothetical protein
MICLAALIEQIINQPEPWCNSIRVLVGRRSIVRHGIKFIRLLNNQSAIVGLRHDAACGLEAGTACLGWGSAGETCTIRDERAISNTRGES